MSSRQVCRGFTLIELLVVVAIIALLIAILLPSLAKAREMSNRTVCAANLKAQGTTSAIYAQQFNDKLPTFTQATGNWLHDQSIEWGDIMLSVAATFNSSSLSSTSLRRMYYCPSNPSQNDNTQWTYTGTTPNYRGLGYTYFNLRAGTPANSGNTFPVISPTLRPVPLLEYHDRWLATRSPSDSELALDEIFSPDAGGSNFVTLSSGIPNTTSHMGGTLPAGSNVLCFDGHVGWRKFSKNQAVNVKVNGAYVWVSNP